MSSNAGKVGKARSGSPTRQRARWLKLQTRTERRWLTLAVVSGLLSAFALVLQASQIAGLVADRVMADGEGAPYLWGFALLLLAVVIRALLSYAREWAGQRASVGVRQRLRAELLQKLARLGPGYCQQQRAGELSTQLLEQVEALDGFIARYLPQQALALGLPLVILLFVLPQNWAAALIFLLTAPLVPLFMALVGMRAAEANSRNFQALANLSAYFLDVIQGLSTLRLFQRSRGEAQVIAQVSDEFRVRTMQVLRIAFLSSAVLEFFASISIAVVAVYLGFSFLHELNFGYWKDAVTLQQALFILILAPEFYQPLRELGTHYHARQEAVAAAERLMALLDEVEPRRLDGTRTLPAGAPEICFDGVSLSYPGRSQPVLQDLSFTLAPEQLVAVIGPSGAGKSSLMNLLLGFQPLQQGQIRVAGVPLEQLDPEAWLASVAWVSQHTTLFPGTLRDNLLLARPDASEVQLQDACRQAHVLEFVDRLPQGLDTTVAEAGAGLSGGQIQRLALARAFLKDAPVLLLDEPTANLDRDSELLVLAALERLSVGRSVLMLTHRPSSMRRADQVWRLQDGRVMALDQTERECLLRETRQLSVVEGGV